MESTSGFLDLYGSTTAPAALYSANRMSPDEDKPCVHFRVEETRSETHPPITGSKSPFYPGVSMPTFPLQLATIPHLSVNGPPSPVSTILRGCERHIVSTRLLSLT